MFLRSLIVGLVLIGLSACSALSSRIATPGFETANLHAVAEGLRDVTNVPGQDVITTSDGRGHKVTTVPKGMIPQIAAAGATQAPISPYGFGGGFVGYPGYGGFGGPLVGGFGFGAPIGGYGVGGLGFGLPFARPTCAVQGPIGRHAVPC